MSLAACANGGSGRAFPSTEEPAPPAAHPTVSVTGTDLGTGMLADTASIRVAFLAPLSGSAAAVGQELLNAAQIAAIEIGPANFVLQPYDTGGTAQGAAQAARSAVSQGARMIVGPLFADSVRAVAPVANEAGIPVVAFSSDATVAGGAVNLIGFVPAEQLRRIFEHAVQKGRHSVAVLVPNTPAGRKTAEAAQSVAAQTGMRLVGAESYQPGGAGADVAMSRLRSRGSFDALLIADTGAGLTSVANQLAMSGIESGPVMILGTMLWDSDPGLGRNRTLTGARFPAPDEAGISAFRQKYENMYGASPSDIAALGHDATALAAVLVRTGPNAITLQTVRNPHGFVGAGGLFRFRADGVAERGLAIREVTASGSTQVEPAPRAFPGPML
nr:penicillin-binding protein activator [Phaeovibrio sulfidiphilus]